MKSPRPKIAYAVVDKIKPVIDTLDIYATDDVRIHPSERMIKVVITEFPKKTRKFRYSK